MGKRPVESRSPRKLRAAGSKNVGDYKMNRTPAAEGRDGYWDEKGGMYGAASKLGSMYNELHRLFAEYESNKHEESGSDGSTPSLMYGLPSSSYEGSDGSRMSPFAAAAAAAAARASTDGTEIWTAESMKLLSGVIKRQSWEGKTAEELGWEWSRVL